MSTRFYVQNVLAFAIFTVMACPVMALDWTSQETLSPYIQFCTEYKQSPYAYPGTPIIKAWKANLADLAMINQGIRADASYRARTGIAEAAYAKSILQGLPQNFWGSSCVDWRDPQYAVKAYRYLVENQGFNPNAVCVAMAQNGLGADAGTLRRTFRLYFPAIRVGNTISVFVDRAYLDAVGVAPQTLYHTHITDCTGTYGLTVGMMYSPWPIASGPYTNITITVPSTPDDTADVLDHRGQGNGHMDNGKQTIYDRGNSAHGL